MKRTYIGYVNNELMLSSAIEGKKTEHMREAELDELLESFKGRKISITIDDGKDDKDVNTIDYTQPSTYTYIDLDNN